MFAEIRRRLIAKMDIEMFKKGWWMLLLIMGTIGVLFTICCILILGHHS
jgi:hypothetical protein